MTTVTRSAIRQEVGLITGTCKTGTTTAAGDSTSVIDTTNFVDSYMNANYYDGRYCIITEGDRAAQVRRVSSYAGATGDFTLNDALTGAPGSGVDFEIHSLDPADINNAINRALARCYYWTYFYPTLVADGDMETSGVTNWTGSSSTPTKSTTVVKAGAQALVATNSGADGYVRTANISVTPQDFYYLEALVRADNETVSLVVYDVTNSAAITLTTSTSYGGREWKRLWTTFQVPSGCEQIQVRLVAASATAVTYWDNVILQKVLHTRLALPSWVTENGNVVQVEYLPSGRSDVNSTSGVNMVDEEAWKPALPQPQVEQDRTAVNPFYLAFAGTVGYTPYRVRCVRQYDSLTSDTATTTAPKEWIAAGAILELLRANILRGPAGAAAEWKNQIQAWRKDWLHLCNIYQPKVAEHRRSPWDG